MLSVYLIERTGDTNRELSLVSFFLQFLPVIFAVLFRKSMSFRASKLKQNDPLLHESKNRNCFSFPESIISKRCILFILVAIACVPIAMILAEAFMKCCGEYLISHEIMAPEFASGDTNSTLETVSTTVQTTFPPATSSLGLGDSIPAAKCGKRIVNYHKFWDIQIEESKIKKLTHLIFAFAYMKSSGDVYLSSNKDKSNLVDMTIKARSVSRDIKVMVAVGGAGRSEHFSSVMSNRQKRRNFIASIAEFLVSYKLDGVDIFWIWPEGKDSDAILSFIIELRVKLTELESSEMRRNPYLISFAYPRSVPRLQSLTILDDLLEHVDFVNVITYDYFGPSWWPETGPTAPLYSGPKGKDFGNVNETMSHLICQSRKPSQFNMGIQFIGRYWKHVQGPIDESDEMWRTAEPVNGTIQGGTITWKLSENRNIDKNKAVWHEESQSSYIWDLKSRTFYSFENERSVMAKMRYVKNNNIGGVFIWAGGSDDDEYDTLLNKVSSWKLCTGEDKNSVQYNC